MFRNYVFTLFVLSLLVMGRAATARAADGVAPSYPDLGCGRRPSLPSCPSGSSPIAARVQSNMYGLATTDAMPTVVAWYKVARARRMVGKRGRKYLVCKERRCKNPDLSEYLTMNRASRSRGHASLSRDIDEQRLQHYRSPGINSREFRLNSVAKETTMFRSYVFTLSVLSLLVMVQPVPARAADACRPVFDALMKAATTPSHSDTTHTAVNGGKAEEAETIFANGQKYIRARGKWMGLPVTSQEVLEQEKEKEEKGKSTCQLLRSESVNGEAATVYSLHREYDEVTEDGQMWASKGSGLPLRVEEDVDNRGNKVMDHRSTHFEYGNVRPPM